MTKRGFHVFVAMALVVCLLCPFVELACGSNDNIFESGQDRESTIAVLLLLLELAFVLASLLTVLLVAVFEKGPLAALPSLRELSSFFAVSLPEPSPPIPLRI